MKKQLFTMALLGALAGFSSCSEEEEMSSLAPTQKDIQINAEIVGYEDPTHARTVIDNEGKVKWEEGDKLIIHWISESNIQNEENPEFKKFTYHSGIFQNSENNTTNIKVGKKHYLLVTNLDDDLFELDWEMDDWGPEINDDPYLIQTFDTVKLPEAIQDENLPGKGIGKRDILTAFTTMIPTGQGDVLNLQMKHLLSLLKFSIVNETGQTLQINKFSLKAPYKTFIDGCICPTYEEDEQGNYVFNEKKTFPTDEPDQSNIANLTVKNAQPIGNGMTYEVNLLTFPFKLTSGQQIEITVSTNKGDFKKTYTMSKDLVFKAGAISTANVKIE